MGCRHGQVALFENNFGFVVAAVAKVDDSIFGSELDVMARAIQNWMEGSESEGRRAIWWLSPPT
jgi:hypothetical protein